MGPTFSGGQNKNRATWSADSWECHLGRMWTRKLHDLRLGPDSVVVEIGPGFSAKIGVGLANLNYRGTLVLVEPNSRARGWALTEYQRLLPKARLRISGHAVPDSDLPAGCRIDAVLGNHLLDDMLLGKFTGSQENDRIFSAMEPGAGCSKRFVETWSRLLSAPATLLELADRVVDDVARYIEDIGPEHLILNEYPSWEHRRSGLAAIHEVSLWALGRLAERLDPSGSPSTRDPVSSTEIIWWLLKEKNNSFQWAENYIFDI